MSFFYNFTKFSKHIKFVHSSTATRHASIQTYRLIYFTCGQIVLSMCGPDSSFNFNLFEMFIIKLCISILRSRASRHCMVYSISSSHDKKVGISRRASEKQLTISHLLISFVAARKGTNKKQKGKPFSGTCYANVFYLSRPTEVSSIISILIKSSITKCNKLPLPEQLCHTQTYPHSNM